MFFRKLLSDEAVENRYVDAGSIFGTAVSYICYGECYGFAGLLRKWEKWEKEYARRGFRTLSLDTFINHDGYGSPLKGLGEKLEDDELPVFHAKIYRERYLGKIERVFDPFELIRSAEKGERRVVTGNYVLPSTED